MRTDTDRDADREAWNAALASGNPALIEETKDRVLANIHTGIMNDTPRYQDAGWTPTERVES